MKIICDCGKKIKIEIIENAKQEPPKPKCPECGGNTFIDAGFCFDSTKRRCHDCGWFEVLGD